MSRLGGFFRQGVRQAQRLFHGLVGLAFLFLALAGVSVTFGEWQSYRQTPSVGIWRFSLIGAFTVVLVIFSLYSFLKARSVR